jgi:lipoprotein-anchoring transpeptidase ErfK/SrfK
MKREQIQATAQLAAVILFTASEIYGEDRRSETSRIVISTSDKTLTLIVNGAVAKKFDVAVGKPSTPTPEGEFHIITRLVNPTYYGPNGVVAPGRNNPLGTRWMGLSAKGYGIHGTNAPASIGKAASHGCIRMRQADLEELFELVGIGTPVELQGASSLELAKVETTAVTAHN